MENRVYCHNLQLKFAVNKKSAHTESQQYQEQKEKNPVLAKDWIANSLVSSTAENVLENASSSQQLG